MQILVLLISSFFLLSDVYAREIEYSFIVKKNCIEVTLCTNGNISGHTEFKVPGIFNLDNSQTKKIKVYINSREEEKTINNGSINLSHPSLAKIKIVYELHKIQDYYSDLYFNLSLGHFFFLGQYCLLTPNILSEELNSIIFKFPNHHSNIISNIKNNGNNLLFLNSTIDELKHSFFAGGMVFSHKINKTGSRILFIGEHQIKQSDVISFLTKIQSIHNDFFLEDKQENYYVFLTDTKHPNSLEGTVVDNVYAFSLGYNTKFNYNIKRLIAHENLHKWFRPEYFGTHNDQQGANCWFIEGITDYYTEYLNYKNGILGIDEYLEIYNKSLVEYYTSPFRFLSNNEIGENPYNTEIFDIAYLRGRIIAHELNDLIQKFSDKKLSIDDYMKKLISLAKSNNNLNFSPRKFKLTLKQFIGYDFDDFVKKHLMQNNILANAQSILDGKAIRIIKKFKAVKYDFDFPKSCLEWSVSGVKYNSNSYKSGLRNSQKILEVIGSKDGSVEFKIKDTNGTKLIKLYQTYEEILVPQYKKLEL